MTTSFIRIASLAIIGMAFAFVLSVQAASDRSPVADAPPAADMSSQLVRDINMATEDSAINDIFATDDWLYFTIETHPTLWDDSESLWRSDGAAGATVRVHDFTTMPININITFLGALGDGVLFSADGRYWYSDGTPNAVIRIHSPDADQLIGIAASYALMAKNHSGGGFELWRYEGGDSRSTFVKSFDAGAIETAHGCERPSTISSTSWPMMAPTAQSYGRATARLMARTWRSS